MSRGIDAENGTRTRELPPERLLAAFKNRLLQELARVAPGAFTLRVLLHRWRGVKIGRGVHIGADVLIETAYPEWISIGNDVQIGVRATILAHVHALPPWKDEQDGHVSVRIEDQAYIGPGVIVLPNVTIGQGAVVAAGSVVTRSVPALTMVQGNPARPIAECGTPLLWGTPLKEFYRRLRPMGARSGEIKSKEDSNSLYLAGSRQPAADPTDK